jgi:hypothetical protein
VSRRPNHAAPLGDADDRERRYRAFLAANGPLTPLSCPFCGMERVRGADPAAVKHRERRGADGWGMRVFLAGGRTMAAMRAPIPPIDHEVDHVPLPDYPAISEAIRVIVPYECANGHRWRMSLRRADDLPWVHEQWDVPDEDGHGE